MWSKIKYPKVPISIKLTLLYAIILSCILVFTSLLTFTGLLYVFFVQAKDDLQQDSVSLLHYLDREHHLDKRIFEKNIISPETILKIYNDKNDLILDNRPEVPDPTPPGITSRPDNQKLDSMYKEILQIIDQDNLQYYETYKQISFHGASYRMHLLSPMLGQTRFLTNLLISLFLTNILGLLIAILSGIFMSSRILNPIRKITQAAREIEVRNLEKRLELSDSNDELHELGTTFNHMLNRIQTGFDKQRRFVSDASHELRTPITVISGYADMLDRWGKEDPVILQEGLDAIKSEAANMYNLIEKLLFLARTDQNRQVLKKERFDTAALLAEIAQETAIIAPEHIFELKKNDSVTLLADVSAIKQMLRIFIENSIKYTPFHGSIILSGEKTSTDWIVTVQDTGIGIDEKEQSQIFQRFYRVDKSRAKATGGSGLGLSIAEWIAKQHDGEIELHSALGEGTSISCKIPL
jgi:signal transduction histidine kinase